MTGHSRPEAKIICDSISEDALHRLTTVEVKLHRFCLAEVNTHRVFSRNSASSRAIPISKQIESVMTDPAMPLSWGSNKPGMQAGEDLDEARSADCEREWLNARDNAVGAARRLSEQGLHKQVVNRLLEPFLWHKVIISATEWSNFFNQRCHKDAQPEIRAAAEAIRDAMEWSTDIVTIPGGLPWWHLPYVLSDEYKIYSFDTLKKVSAARCARVSYNNHDGTREIEKDLDLFDKLRQGQHFSPFEHVARLSPGTRNFKGFVQFREELD